MLPIIGGAISAGLDFLGGLGSSALQHHYQGESYQTAVKDMRKAGLNPALAYQQGGAQSPTAQNFNVGQDAIAGAQGAAQVSFLKSQSVKALAEADLAKANAASTRALQDPRAGWYTSWGGAGVGVGASAAAQARLSSVMGDFLEKTLGVRIQEERVSLLLKQLAGKSAGQQLQLLQYSLPEAKNWSDAQKSFFMQKIAPYLSSARGIVGMVGNIGNYFDPGTGGGNSYNIYPTWR